MTEEKLIELCLKDMELLRTELGGMARYLSFYATGSGTIAGFFHGLHRYDFSGHPDATPAEHSFRRLSVSSQSYYQPIKFSPRAIARILGDGDTTKQDLRKAYLML